MGKRIILQEDIDYQISLLKSLSGNEGYKGTQTNLKTTLNNINSSLGKELRGNYVKIISSINSDFDILCDRADATQRLLQNCRNSFVNLDQELRQEVNNNKLDANLIEGGDKCYIIPGGNSNSSQRVITGYNYNGEKYVTLEGFEKYAEKQALSGNCTSTAWCMGLSIITGESHDATSWPYWGDGGARYVGYKQAFITDDVFGRAYDELLNGKPTMFYAYNGNSISGMHAVTIVGFSNNVTDRASLSANDFLVVDPGDGAIKKLSEVGYNNYSGAQLFTYRDDLK